MQPAKILPQNPPTTQAPTNRQMALTTARQALSLLLYGEPRHIPRADLEQAAGVLGELLAETEVTPC